MISFLKKSAVKLNLKTGNIILYGNMRVERRVLEYREINFYSNKKK
jgi:hypothetical protein